MSLGYISVTKSKTDTWRVEMDIKNTTKMIDKDLNKLNKNYAKGKVYIAGIIKEQEAIIKTSEVEIGKINEELTKSIMKKKESMNNY